MHNVKIRILSAALTVAALASGASAQRIGMYPLETSDSVLALAVPTAVARSLETIDGAITPAPLDMFLAVKQRPAFLATLDKVFSLDALVNGKLEGAAGAYTIAYTIKRGTSSQTVAVRGADFAALVKSSNASLVAALGLKPSATDTQELAAVERNIPAADVVTASAAPGSEGNGAILDKGGQNPWALAAKALVLVGAGKNDQAVALVQPAARAAPADPFVQAAYVVTLVAARKQPETKAALDVAFKLNPAKPELHYLNGRYWLRSAAQVTPEIAQKALDALNLALQYNPRYLEAAISTADLLERFGNAEGAVNVLTRLVARVPDDANLHNRVLDTLLDSDRDGAVNYLKEVVKAYPDVPDSVYALAIRLFDSAAAQKLVDAGELLYSSSAPMAFARGYLLERGGTYEQAVTAYKQALQRDAKFQRAGIALGGALSKLGRLDEAEAALRGAFPELDQKLLARMYLQTGRIDRAKTVLVKLPQNDFEVTYLNGVAAWREYRADDAQKALEAAVKLNNTDDRPKATLLEIPDVRRLGAPKLTGEALYQFRLGQALLDTGNPLEALTAFNKAVKVSPTDVHALLYRGIALLRTTEPDEARDAFVDLAKIAPKNAVVLTYLAAAELTRGRFDLALEQITAALALDKSYARAYYILGMTYFQQYALFGQSSDVTAAREAFQRCIGADANFRVLVDPRLSQLPAK